MKRQVLTLIFGLLLTFESFSHGNISPANIDGIYIRESQTDIHLSSDNGNPSNCIYANRLTIKHGEFNNSQAMVSAALAAHMAGKQISGWVSECHGEQQKVTAIYVHK